jgi:hypothetical protein
MSTVLRRSARKSTTGGDLKVEPRRSARLAAKANKQVSAVQPAAVHVAVVNQPPAVPAVVVSQPAAVHPPSCDCANCKKQLIINTIKLYLSSVESASGSFAKVKIVVDLFEFIDKHFEFINTEEFHVNKRFVITVHDKTIELERDILQQIEYRSRASDSANFWDNDYKFYNKAMILVQRVHTKCHLYGMDKFVLADPIYKNFVSTYMDF